MDNLKISIPGKPEYLTMVRLAATSIASMAGFDIEAAEDIKTAVSEACKNVACHGSSGFSTKYEIECNVDKGSIEIIVRDDCDCHTLEKTCKPCLNCPEEGDLGIIVIKTLMDDVEFGRDDSVHKFVKMGKKL
jgi:serine/threonine-protein kinase RsbW